MLINDSQILDLYSTALLDYSIGLAVSYYLFYLLHVKKINMVILHFLMNLRFFI